MNLNKLHKPVTHYRHRATRVGEPGQFFLHSARSCDRQRLEQYIGERYNQAHQANVTRFMPVLLEMTIRDKTAAAIGLTPGRIRPMFLEQYLEKPIEQQISAIAKLPIDRHRVIETGNLAVTRRGAGLLLFMILASSVARAGYQWMVFTATDEVKRLINALGIQLHYLTDARPERLESGSGDWGTYYQNNPQVMVGNLLEAVTAIQDSPALSAILNVHQSEIAALANSLDDFRRHQSE